MSWFRSLAGPFQAEESQAEGKDEEEEPNEHGRGVKEDLSELRKTFTRQLWGVASFLAPPPATKYEPPVNNNGEQNLQNEEESGGQTSAEGTGQKLPEGIRSDLSELTGKVRTGFSRISSVIHSAGKDESDESHSESDEGNKIGKAMNFPGTFASGINEISRLASSFMPFNQEVVLENSEIFCGEESGAVGVTEEVLTFATNIAKHPETWLDFPIFSDDEDGEDFDMSDVQQEHALAVERLAPRLAALRIELCPGYMSEGQFWKIYFVLLHSRLSKQDALLLSTPQIVEARRLLMQELQKRNKTESNNIGAVSDCPEGKSLFMPREQKFGHFSPIVKNDEKTESFKIVSLQAATPVAAEEFKSDYRPSSQTVSFNSLAASEEPLIQNKDVLARTMKLSDVKNDDEDADADDWLQEEPTGTDVPLSSGAGLGNEDDVSFSDLEDEDDTEVKTTSERVKSIQNSTPKGSKGWVQLDKSSNELEGDLTSSDAYKQEAIGSQPGSKSETQLLSDSSREGSVEQLSKNSERGESNDWLTVEEDDVF